MAEDSGVSITPKVKTDVTRSDFTHSDTLPIANYLGADTSDDNTNSQVKKIAQYLRGDKKEFTDADALFALRSLEDKLGMPAMGETRLTRVYRYVSIQGQIDGLEKEKQRLFSWS